MKYLYTLSYRVPTERAPREYGFNALSDKSAAAKARGMLYGVPAYDIVLTDSETKHNLLEVYDFKEYPPMTTRDLIELIAFWLGMGLIVAGIIHLFWVGWFGGNQ